MEVSPVSPTQTKNGPMVNYDSSIIEKHAEELYIRAGSIVFTSTLVGVILGGGAGWAVSAALGLAEPLDLGVLGAIACGFFGWAYGRRRAFWFKVEAQKALCQVRIEENTRAREASAGERTAEPSAKTDNAIAGNS